MKVLAIVLLSACVIGMAAAVQLKYRGPFRQVGDVQCPDGQSSCPDGTTCCQLASGGYGCCPYPNATCCTDKAHCCPNGYQCNLQKQQCVKSTAGGRLMVKPMMKKINARMAATKAFKLQDVQCPDGQSSCPDGTTCCQLASGGYGCCPYPNATCCTDKAHCCPNGYQCNLQKQQCVKSSSSGKLFFMPLMKKIAATKTEHTEEEIQDIDEEDRSAIKAEGAPSAEEVEAAQSASDSIQSTEQSESMIEDNDNEWATEDAEESQE